MKIIANSLPKSGTHLLGQFLNLIGYSELKPNIAGGQIRLGNSNPFHLLKIHQRIAKNGGFSIDLDNKERKVKAKWLDSILINDEREGYHKAHLPYSKELEEYFFENQIKILYIIRDPRDVLVSHYNWALSNKAHPEYYRIKSFQSQNDALLSMLGGNKYEDNYLKALYDRVLYKAGFSETIKHQKDYKVAPLKERIENSIGWWDSSNTCSVRFEDLIGDKGGGDHKVQIKTISEILNFLNIDNIGDNNIQYIADNLFNSKSNTFNKGVIGRWRDYYGDQLKHEFKKECGQYLIKLGYEKDYNW